MGPHITPLRGIVQIRDLVKLLAIMGSQCIIDTQHTSGCHLCSIALGQQGKSCLVARVYRKWALGSQPIQTALMAYIKDEHPVDPIDRLVLGHDEPTDIALKLLEGLRREHWRKKRSLVTHNLRNLHQWQHADTSRLSGSYGRLSLAAFYRVARLLATSRRIMPLQKSSR